MPYVDPDTRMNLFTVLNPVIDELEATGWKSGDVTYVVYRIVLEFMHKEPLKYANIAAAIGVVECVKSELYRKEVIPYEDGKIAVNGDVLSS